MNLKTFLTAIVTIPILDFLWLGLVATDFYKERMDGLVNIGTNGKIEVVYWAAGMVYLLLALALAFLSEPLIESADQWWMASLNTAFLGFVIYGVYDFTNHATLKTWPLSLVAADVAWGAFVCGVAGTLSWFFAHK